MLFGTSISGRRLISARIIRLFSYGVEACWFTLKIAANFVRKVSLEPSSMPKLFMNSSSTSGNLGSDTGHACKSTRGLAYLPSWLEKALWKTQLGLLFFPGGIWKAASRIIKAGHTQDNGHFLDRPSSGTLPSSMWPTYSIITLVTCSCLASIDSTHSHAVFSVSPACHRYLLPSLPLAGR